MRSLQRSMTIICWSFLLGLAVTPLHAQGVEVSAKIVVHVTSHLQNKKHKDPPTASNVVVWLSPLKPASIPPQLPARQDTLSSGPKEA